MSAHDYPETHLFSIGVLHEMADEEEDLLDLLLDHVLARQPERRVLLAKELRRLALLGDRDRTEALERIDLGWHFDDEQEVLTTLSSIATTLADLD